MALYTNTVNVTDASWIRQAFFVPNRGATRDNNIRTKEMATSKQFSYNTLNYSDTSLGGNRSINPLYQYTENADPNLPSLIARVENSTHPAKNACMGMGRYYAEAVDQNASRVTYQCGVPAYNSLTNFLTGFYDPMHGNMANSGKVGGDLLKTIAQFTGFIMIWAIVPELALMNVLYGTAVKAIADLQQRPMSKFYYMKPAMSLYWSTVTVIVNALTVNMKLAQGVASGDISKTPGQKATMNAAAFGQSAADIKTLSTILPDIWLNNNGGIDIREVANRYHRLTQAHQKIINKIREDSLDTASANAAIKAYIDGGGLKESDIQDQPDFAKTIDAYINSASATGHWLLDQLSDLVSGNNNSTPDQQPDTTVKDAQTSVNEAATATTTMGGEVVNLWNGLTRHLAEYSEVLQGDLGFGQAFVSFVVDWDASTGESFSNSTKESEIASRMNETSRSARSTLFNIANGNIADNIIANSLETAISGIGSIMSGVAASVGFSGLAMLGGKAFVDIPDFWDSSSTSLPTSDYTIKLRTPYGNPISILQDLLVPTAMWIAAAAPRTTGRNSWTGPFLLKLWQKGRVQHQLAMVSNLSIRRGTGNVGWNIQQQPLGIDLTISIINLSKLLHVPITSELSTSDVLQGWTSMFDEDTMFTDYMAVLGSLGLAEQYYPTNRWRLRRARARQNFDTYVSVNNLLCWFANDTLPGTIMSMVAQGRLDF